MSLSFNEAPEQMGRYEIVQRLSAGGMGEVFVARVAGPGGFLRPVALKRIHPHLASDEAFIHMLHDEANVTAAIKHPNVVQILEVGHEGDNHFVVLDYVSGETLSKLRRELIRRNEKMPLWLVAWFGAEVASALHAAHEARSLEGEPLEIIHRDVSLANIMLSDDGRPMLFDFGVAKAKQRMTHTTAGELKGKLAYMAPEIFHGAAVNRTVDLYALGVVLYEMVTNKAPFQRDSDLETMAAIQSAEPTPISDYRPEVDWLLDAIIMRAMTRERDERYQSGAQLEQALREWARKNGQPHDNASAARWLAETFPDKLRERRALLSSVASRQRPIPLSGPLSSTGTNPTFGRSGGREESVSAAIVTPVPSSSATLPAAYAPEPAPVAPPPRSRLLGVIGVAGLLTLGGILALLATHRTAPAVATQPTPTVTAPPSATQTATATATAVPPPVDTPSASVSTKPPTQPSKPAGRGTAAGVTATATQAATPPPTATTPPTPTATSRPTSTATKTPSGLHTDYP